MEQDGNADGQGSAEVAQFVVGGEQGAQRRHGAHEARTAILPDSTDEPNDFWPDPRLARPLELHVCMGLNSCCGHGRDGTGEMAGMGECATVSHVCHGANECRGQGGCGYSGGDAEQAMPGAQECRSSGSCASPINESRVHAAGPFRGTSVWKRARKVFEQRMFEAGVPFGPAPGEGAPDDLVPPYEGKRRYEPCRALDHGQ